MINIKICGFINLENTIKICEKFPEITHIGLNFYKESKRFINKKTAQEISKTINLKFPNIKIVGLFVNETDEFIKEIINSVELDILQFSGNEINSQIKKYKKNFEIWKVIHIENKKSLKKTNEFMDIDNLYGGTGIKINNNLINEFLKKFPNSVVAGGINNENIIELLKETKTNFIDIASGVEKEIGIKDINKIQNLIIKINSL